MQVDQQINSTSERAAAVIIADTNQLHAEAISWCLSAYGAFQSVDHVMTGDALLSLIRSQRPSVIVIAESLIVDTVREVMAELPVRLRETRVAVFVDRLTDRQLDLVANNNVHGLLSRREGTRTICEHLTRIAAGDTVMSPVLTPRASQEPDGTFQARTSRQLSGFTQRQWDVLIRVAAGARVPQVAEELKISRKAVEAHKHRIMRRLGTSDRVDLCRWAIREGLIHA